jgi:hypothetical protein
MIIHNEGWALQQVIFFFPFSNLLPQMIGTDKHDLLINIPSLIKWLSSFLRELAFGLEDFSFAFSISTECKDARGFHMNCIKIYRKQFNFTIKM